MFAHVNAFLKRLRRRLSLTEWLVRCFRLPVAFPATHEPGLVLIQIDGLSRTRMEEALKQGAMPFMRHLAQKERYEIKPHYSGIPSSTPAVQGELLYGVKQCAPAFEYRDCESGRVLLFEQPVSASHMEERLKLQGTGLLKGGSSYGNIFSGGARESHFCLGALNHQSYWKTLSPYTWLLALILNPISILRAFFSITFDWLVSIYSLMRGMLKWDEFVKETKFVPVRSFVTVFLREFITLGCKIDIARGFPVIHANYFGYDELAHRFGASSWPARVALRDIDRSIRAVWGDATRSLVRDYDLWIFSDHGQEDTMPYRFETGRNIQETVQEIFRSCFPERRQAFRQPSVIAHGPLGFIYLESELTDEEKKRVARELAGRGGVPLVLTMVSSGDVWFRTRKGEGFLAERGEEVFGKAHPYLHEVGLDIMALCKNHDCGTLIISGWRLGKQPLSFPLEMGSHGGPGPEETGGFTFLPADAPARPQEGKRYLRPLDLREGIKHFLEGEKREALYSAFISKGPEEPLRVMTYNVHSCIGMDRKLAPERIARVIARHAPDVVCLQELDYGRARTGGAHQADIIASLLGMTYHFFPALRVEEEEYGDAILSRYPMRLLRAGGLAGLTHIPDLEPRGALWVEIDFFGKKIQVINTHLSLLPAERKLEIEDLLGEGWLGHKSCCHPLVFCGDLNILPGDFLSKRLRKLFRDVQRDFLASKGMKTWPSFSPWLRLDYIYIGPSISVQKVDVPDMALERVTSDHLPVIADLKL